MATILEKLIDMKGTWELRAGAMAISENADTEMIAAHYSGLATELGNVIDAYGSAPDLAPAPDKLVTARLDFPDSNGEWIVEYQSQGVPKRKRIKVKIGKTYVDIDGVRSTQGQVLASLWHPKFFKPVLPPGFTYPSGEPSADSVCVIARLKKEQDDHPDEYTIAWVILKTGQWYGYGRGRVDVDEWWPFPVPHSGNPVVAP